MDWDGIPINNDLTDLLSNADLLVLAVAHNEFNKLDPKELAQVNPKLAIFDSVNGWDKQPWEEAGLIYRGLAKK